MNKKTAVLLILITIIAVAPAMAQDKIDIVELENSLVFGYSLAADNMAQTLRFGLNFKLSDAFSVGFIYQQAGTNYTAGSLFLFRYKIAEKLGLGIMIGRTGNPAAGLVVSYDLITNTVNDFSTVLRMKMEYLMQNITTGSVEDGVIGISVTLAFGI